MRVTIIKSRRKYLFWQKAYLLKVWKKKQEKNVKAYLPVDGLHMQISPRQGQKYILPVQALA